METLNQFLHWVLAALLSVLGFFLKDTIDRQKELEDSYNNLHDIYVKKDDFREFKEELWKRLDDMKEEIKKK